MSETSAETPAIAPVVADSFVHLHAHSEYSILDGLNDPYTLLRTAGHLGQPALALTDHGRLSGTVEFWDAAGWYNAVHAERHSAAECEAAKSNLKHPRHKEYLSCHSVAVCRDLERCPKKGTPAPEGVHGTLVPIKAILGIETYVADAGRESREKGDWGHLVLLARTDEGWANLRELASRASLEGFYSKPRIDLELLTRYGSGLIALSSCLGGHLARVWRTSGEAAADALIKRYQSIVGVENYWLELQWHNDQDLEGEPRFHEQHDLNRYLLGAAARTGARLVMANDLHYAWRKDAPLEEIALTIQQQTTLAAVAEAKAAGKSVLSFDTPDFYVKSRREMQAALANWLGAAEVHDPATAAIIRASGRSWLNATLEIAERIELATPFVTGVLHFPTFPIPADYLDATIADPDERMRSGADRYLADEVKRQAVRRYPAMNERTRRLIAYELQCVQELEFAPYFLITADFVDYARREKIGVGLGRGSAPGSVVTYVLGITDVDPIRYGLSEGGIGLTRFLNPVVTYELPLDAFGSLPEPYRSERVPPALEQMVTDLKDALNEQAVAWGRAIRDGLPLSDPATGVPYSSERARKIAEEWPLLRPALLEEWETIKRLGLVEPLWRWLIARRSEVPAGERNEVTSLLARFLGFTSLPSPALIDEKESPFLPRYHFARARQTMPDIDIDFTPTDDNNPEPNGRAKVMRYVVEKYGTDHVCQIATFGTMLAKSAIKDVARAKGLPVGEANALALLIPKKFAAVKDEAGNADDDIPGVSLNEMLTSTMHSVVEGSRELMAAMAADSKVDEIIRLAARLEGMKRTVSTHACGVLITPRPVTDYVSVERVSKGTGVQAVHDGPTLTNILGLLKVDFLGLKNLPINDLCVERIAERRGEQVVWQDVPDDDPAAMHLFHLGRTLGIFQFAGFGGGIAKQMKPRKVGDLMVATALGRPGPMDYIPDYIEARKKGSGTYGDPIFAKYAGPILEDTYGVLVYQEQVMRLSIELAGFTLTESDGLRSATAHKDAAKLASMRDKFIEGAVAKGVNRAWLENWWATTLEPFASYSFNRSHSTSYGLMAYKQAYLKAHYLPEFMAALMTVDQHEPAKEAGATSPLALEIAECRRMSLGIAPIDINRSSNRIEIEPPAEAVPRAALIAHLRSRRSLVESVMAELLSEQEEALTADLANKSPDEAAWERIRDAFGPAFEPEIAAASTAWLADPDHGTLRLSMAAIKGVGDKPVTAILAERHAGGPFAGFPDFLERTLLRERALDPESGRKLPSPINKTVIECLVKVGAFDAFDDRSALLARTALYFGTTSIKKRAEIDWSPIPGYDPAAPKPKDYLDWERELLGVFTSAHPADAIDPAAIEAFAAQAEEREARRVRGTSREVRPAVLEAVASAAGHERSRDDTLRVLAGMITATTWRPNKSGVGGKYQGRIEDATGSCPFTYWRPKSEEPQSLREAFAAFEAAATSGSLLAEGILVAGGFRFNPPYDKEPGIEIEAWTPVALPRVERPAVPVPIPSGHTLTIDKVAEAAVYGGTDSTSGIDALFGVGGPT
jgi:DNA polymerase III alpha subunit